MKREKNKKQSHMILKISLLAVLAVALIILLINGSFAAFINQGYRKGVATTTTAFPMFSSNRLEKYTESANMTRYTFSYTKQDPAPENVEARIYIYNHSEEDATRANINTINYTLNIKIEPLDSGDKLTDGYSVTVNDESALTLNLDKDGTITKSVQSSLEGEVLVQDKWSLKIPYNDLGKNKITITAIPNDGSVLGNQKLGRIFQTLIREEEQVEAFSWNTSGVLLDRNSGNSTNYSAFNFEITGSGVGSGTLIWNPSYVELDQHFLKLKELSADPVNIDENNWKKVTISLDSNDSSYYLLQFYRVGAMAENESWDLISKKTKNTNGGYESSGYIRFSAEKTESN